jgi:hypothetical protein
VKKWLSLLLTNLAVILLICGVVGEVSATTSYDITSFVFSLGSSTLAPNETGIRFSGYLWVQKGGYTFYVPSGLNVGLQISSSASGPWTTVATTQTLSTYYSDTFTAPSTTGTYYYRGHFPTQTVGSETYNEAVSSTWTVTVSYPTTTQLDSLPSMLIASQSGVLYSGQVAASPVPNGATVKLQYATGTTWYDFTTATIGADGYFSKTSNAPPATGTVKVRAYFAEYTTGGVWRASTSDVQTIQMGYGYLTSTITPDKFTSGTNLQYTIRVTNLATNPSGRNIGYLEIAIPTGYTVTSATINSYSKTWNTPVVSAGMIKALASSSSNRITPGEYLDITFTPTVSPTSGTTFTWTTNAWYYAYAFPFLLSGFQPQTTLVTPTVQSTTSTGVIKNEFSIIDTIYASGQYFNGADTVDIYIVTHQDIWSLNDLLVDQSGGKETATTTGAGVLETTAVWANPTPGLYDIVVDINQNGKYDTGDTVDYIDVTAGGNGGLFVVPEYPLGALVAVGSCFVAFLLFKKRSVGLSTR